MSSIMLFCILFVATITLSKLNILLARDPDVYTTTLMGNATIPMVYDDVETTTPMETKTIRMPLDDEIANSTTTTETTSEQIPLSLASEQDLVTTTITENSITPLVDEMETTTATMPLDDEIANSTATTETTTENISLPYWTTLQESEQDLGTTSIMVDSTIQMDNDMETTTATMPLDDEIANITFSTETTTENITLPYWTTLQESEQDLGTTSIMEDSITPLVDEMETTTGTMPLDDEIADGSTTTTNTSTENTPFGELEVTEKEL